MVWWWDSSSRKRAGAQRAGFEPTVPSEPASTDYASTRSRVEVCPPALFDDDFETPRSRVRTLLPPLTTIRQWFQTGWYSTEQSTSARPAPPIAEKTLQDNRLEVARRAFVAALADLDSSTAFDLENRARAAHSLRELWHLRNALFTAVSIGHCESIARSRLADLNKHFQIREQGMVRRSGPVRAMLGIAAREPRA